MKRLLALLFLIVSPAFAQQYTPGPYIPASPPTGETENLIYTTLNPSPEGTNYTWTGFINFNTTGGGLSGGNVPAYNTQTGTFIFGYAQGTVTYNLFDTSEYPANGSLIDSFKYSWEYFNQEFSRGTLSANIKFYDPNNNILENLNFQFGQTTNGWTLFGGEINFADPYDISEIGRIQISFTGKDNRFWAGYYGPQVRALDLSLTYGVAPPPTDFPYWERLAGENELFTLTEPGVVRYGADGVYIYQEFQAGTYACTNGDWGSDPIGGVVKSCDFGSNIPPPVAEVDCVTDPTDPTCIIDSITNDAVDETMLANTSDDDDDNFTDDDILIVDKEEKLYTANADKEIKLLDTDLEKLFADGDNENDTLKLVSSEPMAVSRELSDEEKAAALADAIGKTALEGALAVAGTAAAGSSETSASSSQSVSTVITSASVTTETVSTVRTSSLLADSQIALEAASISIGVEETKQETTETAAGAIDALETGRQLGKESLAAVTAASEQSATDSINQAESIAAASSEIQTAAIVVSETNQSIVNEELENKQSEALASGEEKVTVVAKIEEEQTVIDENVEEVQMIAAIEENTTQETLSEKIEFIEQEKQEEIFVADSSESIEEINTFAELMAVTIVSEVEATDEELELAQQIVAQSQQQSQEETTNSVFTDDEKITIANDPLLANAFNVAPNIANLELTGALGQKKEDKSDAEKAADKVVAANKEEQEAINANYMDADQSGILVAIGADTDVTSYRTAMIRDNNVWYKPEDIYKGVVYKDNARGAYFLEKGNTDTYKKMVEEQYK